MGLPELTLFLPVDRPDTDLFACLIGTPTNGAKERYIGDAVLRLRYRTSFADPELLVPNSPVEEKLEFSATALHIERGSRLTLFISSSSCGYAENSNSGGDTVHETTTLPARVMILGGPEHLSRLRLPVFPAL